MRSHVFAWTTAVSVGMALAKLRAVATVALTVAGAVSASALAEPGPKLDAHSCWASPPGRAVSPLSVYATVAGHATPEQLVRRVLRQLGNRRAIRAIDLRPPPPARRANRWFWGGARPPDDAVWAHVSVGALGGHGASITGRNLAAFEVRVVVRALRDALWAYGFRVSQLRLVHGAETAPVLVVRTDRDRAAFIRDVQPILSSLAAVPPGGATKHGYQDLFFEARDDSGRFVAVVRNPGRGSMWSAVPHLWPYVPHGIA